MLTFLTNIRPIKSVPRHSECKSDLDPVLNDNLDIPIPWSLCAVIIRSARIAIELAFTKHSATETCGYLFDTIRVYIQLIKYYD